MLNRLIFAGAFTILSSCADMPSAPLANQPVLPSLSRGAGASASCATSGAVVATTETQLRAALAAAQPGDVVAVSGMITVNSSVEVQVPEGVTLTCAEPGAGLAANFWRSVLVYAASPNVTVSGLVLRSANTDWPIYVFNGDGRTDVTGVAVRGNSVECGWAGCAFIIGSPRTSVTANTFTAVHQAGTGIHLQGNGAMRVDGSMVTDNVVVANQPTGAPSFGAIRPRDGTDVVVRGNVIRGPWSNGIATTEVHEALFERNKVEGATRFGIFFALIFNRPITVRESLFRANELTSLGGAAIFAQRACGNVFVGNRLTPRAGHATIAFAATTGANVVLGNATDVEDNGNQDCDDDGSVDPNSVSGKTRRGGYAGEIIGTVMPSAGRIEAH